MAVINESEPQTTPFDTLTFTAPAAKSVEEKKPRFIPKNELSKDLSLFAVGLVATGIFTGFPFLIKEYESTPAEAEPLFWLALTVCILLARKKIAPKVAQLLELCYEIELDNKAALEEGFANIQEYLTRRSIE